MYAGKSATCNTSNKQLRFRAFASGSVEICINSFDSVVDAVLLYSGQLRRQTYSTVLHTSLILSPIAAALSFMILR